MPIKPGKTYSQSAKIQKKGGAIEMKKIIIFAIVLSILTILVSCADDETDKLQGKWGTEGWFTIEFSGKDFIITGGEWDYAEGTYSLSDDGTEIELIFEDGDIDVLSFTRTENTLTLDWSGWTPRLNRID